MGQLRAMKRQGNTNTAKRIKTLEEAYAEGLKEGIAKGMQIGREKAAEAGVITGWTKACDHFLDVLYHLDQVDDIGPKRYQKIIERFGYKEKADFAKQNRWEL